MWDKAFRWAIIVLAIAFLFVLRQGVPVQLTLTNSGLHVTGFGTANSGRFELVTVPSGPGGQVLRLDRETGTIDVFHLDGQGQLTLRIQK